MFVEQRNKTIGKIMSDKEDATEFVKSIANSLEQLAVIESLKVKHSESEMTELIKERSFLCGVRTDAIMNKEGDEQVREATEELDNFDYAHPLIRKYWQFAS